MQLTKAICGFQQLSRGDIEAYLFYLRTGVNNRGKPNSDFHIWRAVNHLQYFLEYFERTSRAEATLIPTSKLIWPDDVGNAPQYTSPDVVKSKMKMETFSISRIMHFATRKRSNSLTLV
jgi:hypothetical protein